jgi:hypothetical protein
VSTHWREDYDRLELPLGALSGDDRKQVRAMKARRTLCQRAMRAGLERRPFDQGDPKNGLPWPPGEDVWQAHQYGLEEADWIDAYRKERDDARKMAETAKQARAVLREARKVEREKTARRARRARRAGKVAALIAPVWSRRLRRWRKALAGR